MAKVLNFNTVKKQFMTVILPDADKTTLFIGMPTKKLMDTLMSLKNLESESHIDMGDLFNLCAQIMSRNKARIEVTKDQLEDIFDFEDLVIFVKGYTEFIKTISSQKN